MAAHNYASLFSGERSIGAQAAGVRFHVFVESMIAFVDAHRKRT